MSSEDLPAVHNINQGNAAVILPLLQGLKLIDEDDKVLGLALVEDLVSCVVAASHNESVY